jgi:iron complex outermembrane receptor protein
MLRAPAKPFSGCFKLYLKWLCLCFVFSFTVNAQDTLRMQEVEVRSSKARLSQIGKKSETPDSLTREQFRFSPVSELIGMCTPVYVKSYGPGAIAGLAFRGGNSAQTAILWNGFNLQNSMLGQADLSLLPSMLFEDVTVEYGGSSSLWGSGAIGGTIRLGNRHLFGGGVYGRLNAGAATTGALNTSANAVISEARFISSTKIYNTDSKNNYSYRDVNDGAVRERLNAAYRFTGLMQEFGFLLNARQLLRLNAWVNSNQRRIPGYQQAPSKTYQDDRAARLSGEWTYTRGRYKTIVKGGWFNDVINYTDSIAKLFSKNRVQLFTVENEHYQTWRPGHQFNVGINHSTSFAFTNNYEGPRSLSRTSLLAGERSAFFGGRLTVYVSGRLEYFSVGALPVTGNIGSELMITRNTRLLINAARVYRQPTMNDLYWQPGGNVNLKAEQGWTFEQALQFEKRVAHVNLSASAAVYSRRIDNWIAWIPANNGNPSPFNVQQVWSRGSETTWKLAWEKDKFRAGIKILTSYALSTVTEGLSGSVGKQLIYTPRYTGNLNTWAGYGPLQLMFFSQYTGYRFTASDNSEWLDPYVYSSVKLNYSAILSSIKFTLFGACNNLFNADYEVTRGWPMPLRNYEAGITLQINKNKQP